MCVDAVGHVLSRYVVSYVIQPLFVYAAFLRLRRCKTIAKGCSPFRQFAFSRRFLNRSKVFGSRLR